MQNSNAPSFFDLAKAGRNSKTRRFLEQINCIIDWRKISNIINKHYSKGESVVGKPATPGIMLFKMCLLQTWHGLSDYEIEDRVNDSIAFSDFIGLPLNETAPDHSLVSKFRTELTKTRAFEKLFKEINRQLEKHGVLVKTGAIIDASITPTPRKPKGKPTFEITNDREDPVNEEKEAKEIRVKKVVHSGVDVDARWIKKGSKATFGYKQHVVTDEEGIILTVKTTPANVNEIGNMEDVLSDVQLKKGVPFYGDKGYSSEKNRKLLKRKRLKSKIMYKAAKGKALNETEKEINRQISAVRYKVERTFGSIKRWFKADQARYVGIEKMHTQHLLQAIAYNIYRSPGIIMSGR